MDNAPSPLQSNDPFSSMPSPPIQPTEPPKKSAKMLLFGVLAIAVVALLGGGGWYYIQNQTEPDESTANTTQSASTNPASKQVTGTMYYAEADTSGKAYIYEYDLATQTTKEITSYQYSNSDNTADRNFYAGDYISVDNIAVSADGKKILHTAFTSPTTNGLYEYDIATKKDTVITTWDIDYSKSKYATFPEMPEFVSSGLLSPIYTDDPNVIGIIVGMYEGGYFATFDRATKSVTEMPDGNIPYGPNLPNQGSTYTISKSADLFKKQRREASAIVRTGNLYPLNFNDDASLIYAQSDDAFPTAADQSSTGQYNLIAINTTTGSSEVLATYSDKVFSDLIVSGETVVGAQASGIEQCALHILNRSQKSFDKKTCDDIADTQATYLKSGDQHVVLGNGQNATDDYSTWIVNPKDLSVIATLKTKAKRSFSLLEIRN